MRKIVAIMLILMVCFVFITGCSDETSNEEISNGDTSVQPTQQETEPTGSVPQPPALPEE